MEEKIPKGLYLSANEVNRIDFKGWGYETF